jgi:hypothetical protein
MQFPSLVKQSAGEFVHPEFHEMVVLAVPFPHKTPEKRKEWSRSWLPLSTLEDRCVYKLTCLSIRARSCTI